ncbi:hypothetical protein [Microbacterium sp. SS28]|uniref:hypothetical protein n=1 Tax=Microbacterium sp. SS28 TaxID=2919948 RepID=UPI001FAAADA4|nr:hypothetical protein [Microbacterium sp. SS28]
MGFSPSVGLTEGLDCRLRALVAEPAAGGRLVVGVATGFGLSLAVGVTPGLDSAGVRADDGTPPASPALAALSARSTDRARCTIGASGRRPPGGTVASATVSVVRDTIGIASPALRRGAISATASARSDGAGGGAASDVATGGVEAGETESTGADGLASPRAVSLAGTPASCTPGPPSTPRGAGPASALRCTAPAMSAGGFSGAPRPSAGRTGPGAADGAVATASVDCFSAEGVDRFSRADPGASGIAVRCATGCSLAGAEAPCRPARGAGAAPSVARSSGRAWGVPAGTSAETSGASVCDGSATATSSSGGIPASVSSCALVVRDTVGDAGFAVGCGAEPRTSSAGATARCSPTSVLM